MKWTPTIPLTKIRVEQKHNLHQFIHQFTHIFIRSLLICGHVDQHALQLAYGR